jgi:hypothetical protein
MPTAGWPERRNIHLRPAGNKAGAGYRCRAYALAACILGRVAWLAARRRRDHPIDATILATRRRRRARLRRWPLRGSAGVAAVDRAGQQLAQAIAAAAGAVVEVAAGSIPRRAGAASALAAARRVPEHRDSRRLHGAIQAAHRRSRGRCRKTAAEEPGIAMGPAREAASARSVHPGTDVATPAYRHPARARVHRRIRLAPRRHLGVRVQPVG